MLRPLRQRHPAGLGQGGRSRALVAGSIDGPVLAGSSVGSRGPNWEEQELGWMEMGLPET